MAQDFLSLGLNLTGFTDQKKTILNEFIALFNQLKQYEKININPVLGNGLVDFNSSLKATTILLDNLNLKVSELTENLKSQGIAASNIASGINNINTTNTSVPASSKSKSKNSNTVDDGSDVIVSESDSLKSAEAATRIAAAQTRAAAAATTASNAITVASTAAIEYASETDKVTVALLAQQSATDQITIASQQQAAAAQQQAAAENQLAAAFENLNAAILISPEATATAQNGITKALVAQQAAIGAVSAADANMTRAEKQLATTAGDVAQQRSKANDIQRQSDIKVAEVETKRLASLTEVAVAETAASNASLKAATSTYQKASGSEKAAAAANIESESNRLNTATSEQLAAAQNQAAAAANQLSVAQQKVAFAAYGTSRQQAFANNALLRAQQAVSDAEVQITRANAAIVVGANSSTKALETTGNAAAKIGKGLTTAFNDLRRLAYILPGIGIAGIINLAVESISNLIDELGLLDSSLTKQLDTEKKSIDVVSQSIDSYKSLQDEIHKLQQVMNDFSSTNLKRNLDEVSSSGIDAVTKSEKELEIAKKRFIELKKILIEQPNSPLQDDNIINDKKLEQNIKLSIASQKLLEDKIKQDEYALNQKGIFGARILESEKVLQSGEIVKESDEQLKKRIENNKSSLALLQKNAKEDQSNLDEFVKLKSDITKYDNAKDKLDKDEKRKRNYQFTKEEISLEIEKNKKILSEDEVTEKKRLELIESNRILQNKTAINEFNNIDKSTATKTDIEVAENKLNTSIHKNKIESEIESNKLQIEFAHRRFVANADIQKLELEQSAIHYEEISKAESSSLNERLYNYEKYVNAKSKQQDIELSKQLDFPRFKQPVLDPTVELEKKKLENETKKQKDELISRAHNDVFDIANQDIQNKIRHLKQTNNAGDTTLDAQSAQKIDEVNNLFTQRKISYTKYKDDLKKIEDETRKESLDLDIKNDEKVIDNDKKFLREELKQKIQNAKEARDVAKSHGNDLEVQTQQGIIDASTNQIDSLDESVTTATKKRDADLLKRAQANNRIIEDQKKKEIQDKLEVIAVIHSVEQGLYDVVRDRIDQEARLKDEKLARDKQRIDEQYQYEIDAVNKSSLNSKDKFALDVQLQQQKIQYDKEVEKQHRKIAHDKAIYDKEISIAHIILSTAEAVASSLPVVPLAIAAGVAGAAELAIAANVDIPAYKTGIINKSESGYAITGEDGTEIIKEPYKSPYLVYKETISWLPKGTDVIPLKDDQLLLEPKNVSDWSQTRWLAKQLKPKVTKSKIVNNITINLGFENYKRNLINGKS